MMARPREAFQCADCGVPLVTKYTKPTPEGHRKHGGYGKCDPCYKRELSQRHKATGHTTTHARPLTDTELAYYRRCVAAFIQRRRERLTRQARAGLIRKEAA